MLVRNLRVISAIMKQQCTEKGRLVVNDGMDINAGSAICLGPNNFMEKYYRSVPVGVTVEGSNVLTRNLIIFGQGINKSHPHIIPVLNSILEDDEKAFGESIVPLIKHSVLSYISALWNQCTPTISTENELEKQTIYFLL